MVGGHATRRPTVKQRFFGRFKRLGKYFEKSRLNGHATVVGGHATVGRLSNNIFRTFQPIWGNFEKKSLNGHVTVVEVTRPSADCQTTFFGRFKAIWENFEKSRWTVTRQWLRSRDRRPTVKQRFLDDSSDLGKFWKKSLNGHATVVGGHATVGRLSNNVFWTFQAIWENFEKSRWTVTRQWLRSRNRRPTVKQRFLDVSSDLRRFWKKSLNGHVTVVEVTRPSADCQTTFFGRFKRFGKYFEKSRWTVTRQWSEVTRPSADCQTTYLGRFKRFGEILKKVAERSRDSGWGHATVGRLSNNVFWTFQAIRNFFWKKSLNGHATVVGGHATVGRLSNNVFWTFQAIWENFEKSRWTVTRQWLRSRDRRPTVKQRFLDVSSDLGKFWKKSLNGHATVVGGHATVGRLSNNVF